MSGEKLLFCIDNSPNTNDGTVLCLNSVYVGRKVGNFYFLKIKPTTQWGTSRFIDVTFILEE